MLTKRRLFLLSGTFFLPDIIFGEQVRTPWQGEGPFYPENIPEDSDYNLLKNGDSSVEADGKILNLSGILVDVFYRPLKEVLVEIESLKLFKTKAITIFMVAQFMMGIIVFLEKLITF